MLFLRKLFPVGGRRPHRLYWLSSDLAISGKPEPGDWAAIQSAGIRCVVDLMAEGEDAASLARGHDMEYMRLPVEEGGVPSETEMDRVTAWIVDQIAARGPVLIHCREGKGRSPFLACASFVLAGLPLVHAYQLLRRARPDVALSDRQIEVLQRLSLGHQSTRHGMADT
jgi:protein tyrosine phosphatase (PTP) superfamily phosphohydrolase (DUF442 family)